MKINKGIEIQFCTFLTLALGGSEQSTSYPGCFTKERSSLPIGDEDGWVAKLARALQRREILLTMIGMKSWDSGWPACSLITVVNELPPSPLDHEWGLTNNLSRVNMELSQYYSFYKGQKLQIFQRNLLPPSSGPKQWWTVSEEYKIQVWITTGQKCFIFQVGMTVEM